MRMWNVPVKVMCRNHLLGEHLEMHMFATCIEEGRRLGGYIAHGILDTRLVRERHDELVGEMHRRGYNHRTPLAEIDVEGEGTVDEVASLCELLRRCEECRRRAAIELLMAD